MCEDKNNSDAKTTNSLSDVNEISGVVETVMQSPVCGEEISGAIDGGWGWIVTLSSFMHSFLVDGMCLTFGIFVKDFLLYFGGSNGKTQLLSSVINGAYLSLGFFIPYNFLPVFASDLNLSASQGAILISVIGIYNTVSRILVGLLSDQSWADCILVNSTVLFIGGIATCFVPLYNTYAILIAYSALFGTTVGLVSGPLVEKYGCRRLTIVGVIVASVGLFLSTFSPNLDVMILLYGVVSGVGFGLVYTPSVVIVGHYFNKRRALATGIAVSGSGIGGFVFAPLSVLLIETYGWKGAMWIFSAIVLNGVVFAALYRPLLPLKGSAFASLTETNNKSRYKQLVLAFKHLFNFSLLISPTFALYSFSGILVCTGFFIPYNFLPVFASDLNLSASQGAILISVIGISNTVSRILVGLLSDQSWADCILVNSTVLFIGGIATCFVPLYNTYAILIAYSALFGTTVGFSKPYNFLPVFASDLNLSASQGAILISVIGISNTVSRILVGLLSDQSWADCILVNSTVLFIGGIATCFVPLYNTYAILIAYSALFGTTVGTFVALKSIILVELKGDKWLSKTLGLVNFMLSISVFIGSPVAGALSDLTESYDVAFYFSGGTIALAGLLCFPLRYTARWERDRHSQIDETTKPRLTSMWTLHM